MVAFSTSFSVFEIKNKPHVDPVNFFDIPQDLIIQIFSNFSYKELVLASRVCKKWNILSQDERFWKICLMQLGLEIVPDKDIKQQLIHSIEQNIFDEETLLKELKKSFKRAKDKQKLVLINFHIFNSTSKSTIFTQIKIVPKTTYKKRLEETEPLFAELEKQGKFKLIKSNVRGNENKAEIEEDLRGTDLEDCQKQIFGRVCLVEKNKNYLLIANYHIYPDLLEKIENVFLQVFYF